MPMEAVWSVPLDHVSGDPPLAFPDFDGILHILEGSLGQFTGHLPAKPRVAVHSAAYRNGAPGRWALQQP